jgi:hypothetical protein
MITWIYGPQGDFDKQMFVRELRQLKHSALPGWLLIEDFNLIYMAHEQIQQGSQPLGG